MRIKVLATAALSAMVLAPTSSAQVTSGSLVAQQTQRMDAAIARWEDLQKNRQLSFSDYAEFAIAYPDFPRTSVLRVRAENTLAVEAPPQADLLRFFDAHPPLTNAGRARYALALSAAQRPEALEVARAAWRGGQMSGPAEAYIVGLFGSQLTAEDHVARMDALLWQEAGEAAARQIINLPVDQRDMAMARLALVQGELPSQAGLPTPTNAQRNAGYVFNLVNYYRSKRQTGAAISLLANRPQFDAPALDGEEFIGDMLAVAKASSALDAARIAAKVDDLFKPGEDISQGSFKLRDEYTDLMWLGGTKALWELGDGERAASLFERYGKAARSPLTKAKGFFWAGRAALQSGNRAGAAAYFEQAAQWPDYYYGQLAISALGRQMPAFAERPQLQISAEQRREFESRPIAQALIAIGNNRRAWQTERRFFQALGDSVANETEMLMAADLAARLNMPEAAVVLGFKNGERGFKNIDRIGYPTIETPLVNDWVMTHAISRQESEFDRTRVSHAGARGIMQLMPGTAREQSGMLGVQYMSANLINSPSYNIRLGDAYFARMMSYYGGAYPLAVGAYNAGPGRVNQWLRLNGDPRKGEIDWVTWVERIPANFETRYYIMRVLGNAVTYSHMYPEQAGLPRPIDSFLP
ncbi:MAG: lytic transglycosylase domain-containing protein [Pseudomonadota bacterium]|nr:lytic transglycosylase domain-containing protein [Pseudomonadota bacterium]